MSFYYTRIYKEEEKMKGWGFKKVNTSELSRIVNRVTRPTYNSRMHNTEYTQVHNYRFQNTKSSTTQASATMCAKQHSGSAFPRATAERRLSERELRRVVRRLTRPTASSEARCEYLQEGDHFSVRSQRPRSCPDDNRQKALAQLSRPTTASRAKTLGDCTLCADQEELQLKNSLVPFEYDYGEEKMLAPEELDFIVERISAPTFAHKNLRCPRTPKPVNEVQIRRKVPLASGLPRSKNVKEIVQRLYSASKVKYRATAATAITI